MKRAAGFSLVEVMVAMTLGLLVLGALLGLFAGTRTANRSTIGIAGLTDGGRFALDFIGQAGRNAGFYACNNPQRLATTLNNGPTPLLYAFGNPVSGFEATVSAPGSAIALAPAPVSGDGNAGDWIGGLDPALMGLAAGQPVQGSDVLVVYTSLPRVNATAPVPVTVTAIADGADNFQVNAPGQLATGQLAAISDCVKTVVFQITAFDGVNVFHDAAGFIPGNSGSAFPVSFSVGAQVMPVTATIYYIGVGADGDGALFTRGLNATGSWAAPVELVPDIENMQILYGYDVNGDQTTYQYMTADQVAAWAQVASIRVAVLAASAPGATPVPTAARTFNLLGTTVTPALDSRSRQAFDTTITIRNSVP